MPRGGYREPSSPAAVSGPGALSQRTDTRLDASAGYGTAQPLNDAAASLGPNAGTTPQSSGPPPGPGQPPPTEGDVFGPTNKPDEPITQGSPFGPGDGPMLPNDTYDTLRAMYDMTSDPGLLKLIMSLEGSGQ